MNKPRALLVTKAPKVQYEKISGKKIKFDKN